jgi:hypothetical protein
VHELLQNVLLVMIALHIAGALFQHFVLRSQVLMRMFRPEPDSRVPGNHPQDIQRLQSAGSGTGAPSSGPTAGAMSV